MWIFLFIVFSIYIICLIMFGITSSQFGSGIKLTKGTVNTLWASLWISLVIMIVSAIMDSRSRIQNEIEEWNTFVKENQCVLVKINKTKKDNVWSCRNGTLEVISDYID